MKNSKTPYQSNPLEDTPARPWFILYALAAAGIIVMLFCSGCAHWHAGYDPTDSKPVNGKSAAVFVERIYNGNGAPVKLCQTCLATGATVEKTAALVEKQTGWRYDPTTKHFWPPL